MKLQHLCILSAAVGSLAAAVEKRANSGFKFYGVSESGAEFGQTKLPGTLGKDYTWPVTSSIDTLMSKGLNTFRIPFLMERLAPNGITGSFDQTYLSGLTTIVNYITGKGAYAIVDPHNYGRYNNNIITSASDFQTFWKNLAAQFASNSKAIFDTNNEYNTEDNQNVANLNQAAINGIRAAGATSQYIFVEGNQWSGAWDWISDGTAAVMVNLTDPQNKIIYEMHQYLDSDDSGTSATCVNSTIGSTRLQAATAWLKANNKTGVIGETGAAANSVCVAALTDMLKYMQTNKDVWSGWLLWGAGPWWGNYIYGMEPPSGAAYTGVLPSLTPYIG